MTKIIVARKICWPNPDATCLEGGCGYCNNYQFRKIEEIKEYAKNAGNVNNRGIGNQDAWKAFRTGFENDFYNATVKWG